MEYVITIIFIIITAISIPGIIRQKLFKELAVFLILMGIALTYSYSYMFDWNLPELNKIVTSVFEPLAKALFGKADK